MIHGADIFFLECVQRYRVSVDCGVYETMGARVKCADYTMESHGPYVLS